MRKLKDKKGITLVALVITIVILLILAGVSLNLVLGDQGLIKKADKGRENYIKASEEERALLGRLSDQLDAYASGNGGAGGGGTGNLDWTTILANATEKHPDQDESNDIGIGTDGNLVNLDLWNYDIINDNEIILCNMNVDSYNAAPEVFRGYIGPIENGRIIGTVPQYIKINGVGDFLPVTSMNQTFYQSNLIYAPVIPTTVVSLYETFCWCSDLTTAPVIPPNVDNVSRCFQDCSALTGELIINSTCSNDFEYGGCLYGAAQEDNCNLQISGSCPYLSEIICTEFNSHITLNFSPAHCVAFRRDGITYTWEDVHEIAGLISEMSNVNRTTGSVTVLYKGNNITLNTGDEFSLVGNAAPNGYTRYYMYKVRILGFNTDTLSSTGNSDRLYSNGGNKAGITFQFTNFFSWNGIDEYRPMNSSSSPYNDTLNNTNEGGWGASGMRRELNSSEVLARLTNASCIKTVDKLYLLTYNLSTQSTSQDKLWLLAASEIGPYKGTTAPKYGYAQDAESEVDANGNGQYKWYYDNVTTNSSSEVLTKKDSNYGMYPYYGNRKYKILAFTFSAI